MSADLSIVILCYKAREKAREFTQQVIKEVGSVTDNWEIVLVGNYLKNDTADTTPKIVRELAANDKRIKALTLEKEGMMGWDARTGLSQATGNSIAFIDGDGQMPPQDITSVYRKLKEGNLDMVKTYREKRHDGLSRKVNSDIFNILFRILFPGFPVRDVNSKPKIFTREFLNKLELTSDDWFLDAEIIIQARRHHCRMAEIPTIFYDVEGRKSFVRPNHIIEFLKNLLIARLKEFLV